MWTEKRLYFPTVWWVQVEVTFNLWTGTMSDSSEKAPFLRQSGAEPQNLVFPRPPLMINLEGNQA